MEKNFNGLKNIFSDYPYVAAAYLFGSYAGKKAAPMSDIQSKIDVIMDNLDKLQTLRP